MADPAELANRFAFHAAQTQERRDEHERVRDAVGELAVKLNEWLPEGREKSVVFTNLEQAMFWANAGIARQGA
ncbi:Acb2/Tad1 domain-containing protein [Nocardia aurea]|uniref:Acb2/Tad1 domain-containing protein n=1 Tax=Nocardia aurea TaxID=2144174 RepID=UPI0033B2098D